VPSERGADPHFDALVRRALDREPSRRHAGAVELAREFEDAAAASLAIGSADTAALEPGPVVPGGSKPFSSLLRRFVADYESALASEPGPGSGGRALPAPLEQRPAPVPVHVLAMVSVPTAPAALAADTITIRPEGRPVERSRIIGPPLVLLLLLVAVGIVLVLSEPWAHGRRPSGPAAVSEELSLDRLVLEPAAALAPSWTLGGPLPGLAANPYFARGAEGLSPALVFLETRGVTAPGDLHRAYVVGLGFKDETGYAAFELKDEADAAALLQANAAPPGATRWAGRRGRFVAVAFHGEREDAFVHRFAFERLVSFLAARLETAPLPQASLLAPTYVPDPLPAFPGDPERLRDDAVYVGEEIGFLAGPFLPQDLGKDVDRIARVYLCRIDLRDGGAEGAVWYIVARADDADLRARLARAFRDRGGAYLDRPPFVGAVLAGIYTRVDVDLTLIGARTAAAREVLVRVLEERLGGGPAVRPAPAEALVLPAEGLPRGVARATASGPFRPAPQVFRTLALPDGVARTLASLPASAVARSRAIHTRFEPGPAHVLVIELPDAPLAARVRDRLRQAGSPPPEDFVVIGRDRLVAIAYVTRRSTPTFYVRAAVAAELRLRLALAR
jgi:hypothetical protein